MKNILLLCLLLALAAPAIAGDKPELKWKKLDAGLAEAKRSNKIILMDVYTDWCGWCKKLDREVYTDENVAKVLTSDYVLVKVNAESNAPVTYKGQTSSEMQLAQSFGVSGYPTIFFLEPSGEPIDALGGFVDAQKFLPIAKYFGEKHYKTMTWPEYQKHASGTN